MDEIKKPYTSSQQEQEFSVDIPDSFWSLMDECFETRDDAKRWWVEPHTLLNNLAPSQVPLSEAENLLDRLDYLLDAERGEPSNLKPRQKIHYD